MTQLTAVQNKFNATICQTEKRKKLLNKVLERQLDELKLEIEEITFAFKQMAGFDPMASITPKQMMQAFERDTKATVYPK